MVASRGSLHAFEEYHSCGATGWLAKIISIENIP